MTRWTATKTETRAFCAPPAGIRERGPGTRVCFSG